MNATLTVGDSVKSFGYSKRKLVLKEACGRFTGAWVCVRHGLLHEDDSRVLANTVRDEHKKVCKSNLWWWCTGHEAEVNNGL